MQLMFPVSNTAQGIIKTPNIKKKLHDVDIFLKTTNNQQIMFMPIDWSVALTGNATPIIAFVSVRWKKK